MSERSERQSNLRRRDELLTTPPPPDLADLRVLVPRARRYCLGPFPSATLTDNQLYAMVADAFADIVMLSGDSYGRSIIVTERDPTAGYPIAWKADQPLNEWESALITTQTALNFFFHEFKDKKVSETIQNEGQSWDYDLSPLVLRQQFQVLVETRDKAMVQLYEFYPAMARFGSVLAVRDRVTSALIEWWAAPHPGSVGVVGGLGGGQEAAVVPVFFPPDI